MTPSPTGPTKGRPDTTPASPPPQSPAPIYSRIAFPEIRDPTKAQNKDAEDSVSKMVEAADEGEVPWARGLSDWLFGGVAPESFDEDGEEEEDE